MTREQLQSAYERADAMMKQSNGHSFMTILKTRCMHCGRSPNQTGKCRGWFQTFLECLTRVLTEAQ